MVVLSAIFGKRDGPDAAVVDAIATGDVRLAISDDGLAEFVRVVGYPNVEELIKRPVRAVEVALSIGTMGYMHHPRRLDWPSLADPKDGWVFDLAYAAKADYIVSYDAHVREAAAALEFVALRPEALLETLSRRYER
jgi:predicted nucleic acid-binding protein